MDRFVDKRKKLQTLFDIRFQLSKVPPENSFHSKCGVLLSTGERDKNEKIRKRKKKWKNIHMTIRVKKY